MTAAETMPVYVIEDFIQSCLDLSDLCFDAQDLSHIGQFCIDVKTTIAEQGYLSDGMKRLLSHDVVFQNYLPSMESLYSSVSILSR